MARKSRIQQMEAIQVKASDLKEELDELIDEFQEALDNFPENLQNSDRAQTMQDRIDLLDSWRTDLENISEEDLE